MPHLAGHATPLNTLERINYVIKKPEIRVHASDLRPQTKRRLTLILRGESYGLIIRIACMQRAQFQGITLPYA